MLILDSLLIGGLRFVLDKLLRAAEAEGEDRSGLRERLLEAQTRLERGEITDEELAALERDFIAALGARRGAPQGPISMSPGDATAEIQGLDLDC
jgi:hypothetical protein